MYLLQLGKTHSGATATLLFDAVPAEDTDGCKTISVMKNDTLQIRSDR